VPPIFRWLAQSGPVEPQECRRTFNMGIGMTIVVPAAQAERAVQFFNAQGEKEYIDDPTREKEIASALQSVAEWCK